jgi:hypothetical protein
LAWWLEKGAHPSNANVFLARIERIHHEGLGLLDQLAWFGAGQFLTTFWSVSDQIIMNRGFANPKFPGNLALLSCRALVSQIV